MEADTNHHPGTLHPLSENASADACIGCDLALEFRENRMTFSGAIVGFDSAHPLIGPLPRMALELATVEKHLRAAEPIHRHDQAIVSLLMHRDRGDVISSDGMVHGGWTSPRQVDCQKIWCHRRAMRDHAQEYFARHLALPGPARTPSEPVSRRGLRAARASLARATHIAVGEPPGRRGFPYRTGSRSRSSRWPEETLTDRCHDGDGD